jgi:hypothetical protein
MQDDRLNYCLLHDVLVVYGIDVELNVPLSVLLPKFVSSYHQIVNHVRGKDVITTLPKGYSTTGIRSSDTTLFT